MSKKLTFIVGDDGNVVAETIFEGRKSAFDIGPIPGITIPASEPIEYDRQAGVAENFRRGFRRYRRR